MSRQELKSALQKVNHPPHNGGSSSRSETVRFHAVEIIRYGRPVRPLGQKRMWGPFNEIERIELRHSPLNTAHCVPRMRWKDVILKSALVTSSTTNSFQEQAGMKAMINFPPANHAYMVDGACGRNATTSSAMQRIPHREVNQPRGWVQRGWRGAAPLRI